MTLAGAAMALSSTSVVLSSMWLRRYRRPRSVQNLDEQFASVADRTSTVTSEMTLTYNPVNKRAVDLDCTCVCCLQAADLQARSELPSAQGVALPAVEGCPASICCSQNKDRILDNIEQFNEQENDTAPLLSSEPKDVVLQGALNRTCDCECSSCRCALLHVRRRAG
jgi:hypothetical protein